MITLCPLCSHKLSSHGHNHKQCLTCQLKCIYDPEDLNKLKTIIFIKYNIQYNYYIDTNILFIIKNKIVSSYRLQIASLSIDRIIEQILKFSILL